MRVIINNLRVQINRFTNKFPEICLKIYIFQINKYESNDYTRIFIAYKNFRNFMKRKEDTYNNNNDTLIPDILNNYNCIANAYFFFLLDSFFNTKFKSSVNVFKFWKL